MLIRDCKPGNLVDIFGRNAIIVGSKLTRFKRHVVWCDNWEPGLVVWDTDVTVITHSIYVQRPKALKKRAESYKQVDAIFDYLRKNGPSRFADIVKDTGVPKGRLQHTLVRYKKIQRAPDGERWMLASETEVCNGAK